MEDRDETAKMMAGMSPKDRAIAESLVEAMNSAMSKAKENLRPELKGIIILVLNDYITFFGRLDKKLLLSKLLGIITEEELKELKTSMVRSLYPVLMLLGMTMKDIEGSFEKNIDSMSNL